MGRYSLALGVLLLLGAITVVQSQSTPRPISSQFLLTVTDENGVAVPSARAFLQMPNSQILRCEADFSGSCYFLGFPPGTYRLRVEKEGFYALDLPSLAVTAGAKLEVSLFHVQEIREVVNVVESPPAVDPAQVSSQEKLSGLDVINIPYPAARDSRNVLNFIPGVVQAGFGGIHIAGAQTYQTLTLPDAFNIPHPTTGPTLSRARTNAFP